MMPKMHTEEQANNMIFTTKLEERLAKFVLCGSIIITVSEKITKITEYAQNDNSKGNTINTTKPTTWERCGSTENQRQSRLPDSVPFL